jgi:prolyl-tRNA editing enzyme YbaK/EbsC (Cys-tRNA(Pro) deacylase)
VPRRLITGLAQLILDWCLAERDSVVLEAGSHERSVRMKAADLVRLTWAQVDDISRQDR